MARFKYLGQAPNSWLAALGPCYTINIPKKDGTKMTVNAADPVGGFVIGADIGVDITDERSIRVMQADVRFQQIS